MSENDHHSEDDDRFAAFSEAFDRLGPGKELTAEGVSLGISEAEQRHLLTEWQTLSEGLQGFEVRSANLSATVMAEIGAPQAAEFQGADKIARSDFSRLQIAKIGALAVTTAALLFVAVRVATHETSLNRSAEVLASFSFDPQGWDVVVVTVSDEQADELAREFQQLPTETDLNVLPVLENQPTERNSIDVVMASKETSEKLLGRLAAGDSVAAAEWNPEKVGELERDELLKRFAVSMQTPTKSDLYFREVLVVTSGDDEGFRVSSRPSAGAADGAMVASNQQSDAENTGAEADFQKNPASSAAGVSVMEKLQKNSQRPVMVVLKRRPPESQGQLPAEVPDMAFYL